MWKEKKTIWRKNFLHLGPKTAGRGSSSSPQPSAKGKVLPEDGWVDELYTVCGWVDVGVCTSIKSSIHPG